MTSKDRTALIELLRRQPAARTVRSAQSVWAPELSFGRHFGPPPHHARNAAVLIAVFLRDGQWMTTLTRRPEALKTHGGQICFPGGGVEGAESLWQCAQREWVEELGAAPNWELVTTLSDIYVFASNHTIRSFVAATDEPPEYSPCPNEVDEVLEVPLAYFGDPKSRGTREIARWGTHFRSPAYDWEQDQIWGATAILIAELALRLEAE